MVQNGLISQEQHTIKTFRFIYRLYWKQIKNYFLLNRFIYMIMRSMERSDLNHFSVEPDSSTPPKQFKRQIFQRIFLIDRKPKWAQSKNLETRRKDHIHRPPLQIECRYLAMKVGTFSRRRTGNPKTQLTLLRSAKRKFKEKNRLNCIVNCIV